MSSQDQAYQIQRVAKAYYATATYHLQREKGAGLQLKIKGDLGRINEKIVEYETDQNKKPANPFLKKETS